MPVPVTSVGSAGGSVVDVVELVVEDVVLDVVDDVVDEDVLLDVVELELVDELDEVVEPPVTLTVVKAVAGTGFVPVHAGAGAGPQPTGVGVPGVQAKVTAMIPPGPTLAVVLLSPSRMLRSPPAAVQVDVGSVAETESGVALSSPDVLFAGVGSVMVVLPVTVNGGKVCDDSVAPLASSVTVTSAGMEFAPADSKPRP